MGIEDLLTWYQRKISIHDKQQWEKSIEQSLLQSLPNIQLKTVKPRNDLLDLDLVRGSSFTKAKPKHAFFTVLRLSIIRVAFLPCFRNWWIQQTSGRIFVVLLLLYIGQLVNIALVPCRADCLQTVPLSEFAVPVVMIWTVSYVHSQIVATSGSELDLHCKRDYKRRLRKRQCQANAKTRRCACSRFGDDGFESFIGDNGDAGTSLSPPHPAMRRQSAPNISAAAGCACASCSDTDEEVTSTTSGQMGSGNAEHCSYYSSDASDSEGTYDIDAASPADASFQSPCCSPAERVTCTLWDRHEVKKAELSVYEISSVIISRVEAMPENRDCFYLGMLVTALLSLLPAACRFCDHAIDAAGDDEVQVSFLQITHLLVGKATSSSEVLDALLGASACERVFIAITTVQRFVLGMFIFFLLSVAERSFKQRFLYAKFFSHLTSSRRARKSDVPHFRLNKVRHIITWLSVRSYLKKRGPQRSVEVIVSAAFVATLLLLSILCVELLKDTFVLNSQANIEILIWSLGLGIIILRFMVLGVKTNKKYRNLSALITEQINLYLQIEQKPNKKDELMVANSVLKLAADLLKELESHYKILGLSANPVFYNITKVVILSALSGVLSEILGFKLKLHKIKIK